MSYVLCPAQKQVYPLKRRSSRRPSLRLAYKQKLVYILIFFIVSLFVLYTFQANSLSSDSYKLQEYQKRVSELQKKQRELQLKVSEVRSLSFLEKKVEELNMVQAEKVEYLSSTTEMAAK